MERREKAEFVLEQMRYLLDVNDFIRANMVSRKLSEKVLNDKDFEDVKVQFYQHMIRYHTEKKNYMDLFRCWHSIYNTNIVKDNAEQMVDALETAIGFLALSPRDNEQHDMLHRIKQDENTEKLPACASILKMLTTKELVEMQNVDSLFSELSGKGAWKSAEQSELRWADLKKRMTEHNIFVISEHYTRITMARLSALLQLEMDATEKFLCDMVTSSALYAKIDRPAGIVVFQAAKTPNELLNGWATDISSLLDIMEECTHLIYKENIAHKIKT